MPDRISELRSKIKTLADKKVAETMQWFFKTGRGDYGEGDVFIGLKVPVQRKLAREFRDLSLTEIKKLLTSTVHEERLISLFILIDKYQKMDEKGKKEIFNFYLKNRKGINNWDLVDISAPKIIGKHLREKDKSILFKFALSKNLWERRIAILSTQELIKNDDFAPTLQIAEMLINDEHDLIHKAVGWMLREIGKKDLATEEKFLKIHYKNMPRTMLRYAIEKFPETKRKKYLQGKI
ncbi:MAG: DNA alkylation repair protein [Ignavibacteriaceae bacterium]|jgi:3-methyladenine DNA glycosylase AlkD|nr:DNA alkylation repair protein [Ignavibacteriaceae bacterium]MCW8996019.1 DNA alkylation repair protein [Psychromonas sp.]MCW8818617.1 DNA alkylation repair protein [Ignavibacteriaceae bacterium]MCW8823901.1 DNA alkylation repair protein [Ignavibacteriaceae bacterium]MCW9094279.1 DNA alkylation repair protein [Ignavibacteriaceae bacterium]